jgi:hypothetical protein
VAAVALAVVVLTLGRAARHRGADLLSNVTVVAGISAAVVSLVQCGLGLVLAGWAGPGGDARGAGLLFAAISRLDGVKMLALAAMAVSAAVDTGGGCCLVGSATSVILAAAGDSVSAICC